MEKVGEFTKMDTLNDYKDHMRIMLDFYFDVIQSFKGNKASSELEDDCNIWIQQMFSMGNHFLSLLDGVGYRRGTTILNPIIDPDILFTVVRRIYESVVVFETLFILPKDENHQTILYNLFMAHGLSERLRVIDDEMRKDYQERIAEEERNIEACKKAIKECPLYATLDKQRKSVIDNAFGKKYRYVFSEDDKLESIKYETAYKVIRVKEELFNSLYSFFSLHGHPSFLSICQYREAFVPEHREDVMMAKFATECTLSFMSIFIVDYMKLNPLVKRMYDKLELARQCIIGKYEYMMRC